MMLTSINQTAIPFTSHVDSALDSNTKLKNMDKDKDENVDVGENSERKSAKYSGKQVKRPSDGNTMTVASVLNSSAHAAHSIHSTVNDCPSKLSFPIMILDDDLSFYRSGSELEKLFTYSSLKSFFFRPSSILIEKEEAKESFLKAVSDIKPHLIIADIGSHPEWIKLISCLRQSIKTSRIPIIVLSKNQDLDLKLTMFHSGVVDYIDKASCHELEVLARVKRRVNEYRFSGDLVQVGNLCINTVTQNVFYSSDNDTLPQTEVELSFLEYKILMFFINNNDRNITRSQIIDNVWGEGTHITNRTVDVHISGLRRRCPAIASYIKTIYGHGYKFSSIADGPLSPAPTVASISGGASSSNSVFLEF